MNEAIETLNWHDVTMSIEHTKFCEGIGKKLARQKVWNDWRKCKAAANAAQKKFPAYCWENHQRAIIMGYVEEAMGNGILSAYEMTNFVCEISHQLQWTRF